MPELRPTREGERAAEPTLIAASATSSYEDLSKEDEGWRLAGPRQVGPLDEMTRDRAVEAAEKLFYSSPLAHRAIEQVTDFVVGEQGFELTSTDKRAAPILAEFWNSPVNNIPKQLYSVVQEYFVYGETCFLTKVHDDGFVGITFVPAAEIGEVEPSDGLPGEPSVVELQSGQRLDVISWNSVQQRLDGECFFFRSQHLGSSVRGFPRFLPLIDFLRAWESFTYNYLTRRALYDAIWWDVELEGYNQDQIDDWLASKRARPPEPGSVYAHNEKVDWNLTKPDFRASNLDKDGQFFLQFLHGSAGLSDYVPTTARRRRARGEILDPVARGLSTRQFQVRACYNYVGKFVLQEAISHGLLEEPATKEGYEVLCRAPRLGVRDFQRSSGALDRFVDSLNKAVDAGYLGRKEAGELFRDMLSRLGMVERSLPPLEPEEVTAP